MEDSPLDWLKKLREEKEFDRVVFVTGGKSQTIRVDPEFEAKLTDRWGAIQPGATLKLTPCLGGLENNVGSRTFRKPDLNAGMRLTDCPSCGERHAYAEHLQAQVSQASVLYQNLVDRFTDLATATVKSGNPSEVAKMIASIYKAREEAESRLRDDLYKAREEKLLTEAFAEIEANKNQNRKWYDGPAGQAILTLVYHQAEKAGLVPEGTALTTFAAMETQRIGGGGGNV